MRSANLTSGVILFLFGAAMLLFVIPAQIEEGPDYAMSPRLVPQMMVGLIMGLSVLLVLTNLRRGSDTGPPPFTRDELIAFGSIMGLFGAALVLYFTVGVLAAVLLLVVGALAILGERRVLVYILMPLCLIGGTYLLFSRVLGTVIM